MFHAVKKSLLLLAAAAVAPSLSAQYLNQHGVTVSVGATGQFTTQLTSSPITSSNVVSSTAGGVINTTISNQQQFTTLSVGGLASLQFHPRPWAGIEVNYGFTRNSERFSFNSSGATSSQSINLGTGIHEATGAYQFHPHHIPLQPFVNIGGGELFFVPNGSSYQSRATGLVETGVDLPTHIQHLAFRIQGRALIYRAPNFYNPAISTRSWRATTEPAISAVYRF